MNSATDCGHVLTSLSDTVNSFNKGGSMAGEQVLDARALNRATLERQFLLRRVGRPVLELVDHLVGMQAQVPNDPYLALWSRIEGFDPAELAQLMLERRVVRCGLMRGTIHLVTARDSVALRPLMQPLFDRTYRGRSFAGRLGADLDEVKAACLELLRERPRTKAEVKAALSERWPDHEAEALAYVLPLVPAVQVTPRGVWGKSAQARWALTEDWVGGQEDARTTIDQVVLRYLAAFGPATVSDVRQWCGITGLKEVVERLRPRLLTFRDTSGREVFDLPDAPRPDPETPAPPRFFPEYDNVFISHADRSRMAPEELRGTMSTAWLAMDRPPASKPPEVVPLSFSMFSVDGFLSGTWKVEKQAGCATLLLQPMVRISDAGREALHAEGRRLLGLLTGGSQVEKLDVRFVSG
jgi:hypothetical protein